LNKNQKEDGWSSLRSNNKSHDIEGHELIEPLLWVKDDILGSAHLAMENMGDIIYTMIEEYRALTAEVEVTSGSGGLHEQRVDLEARILDSLSRIGGRDWQPPSAVQYKGKQRL
jgi:hypothetical protein